MTKPLNETEDDRASDLISKYGSGEYSPDMDYEAFISRKTAPKTLEEMEWSLTVRRHVRFALPDLRLARDKIEQLISQGWTNHGWFNRSPIGSLLPDETGLRLKVGAMRDRNEPHELIGFWFNDDDSRYFLLTPPTD